MQEHTACAPSSRAITAAETTASAAAVTEFSRRLISRLAPIRASSAAGSNSGSGFRNLANRPPGHSMTSHTEFRTGPMTRVTNALRRERSGTATPSQPRARWWARRCEELRCQGPVQGRYPLGLRFLRTFRLARTVEGDRLANERLEGGLVNFFSLVDADLAAYVSIEIRVEDSGWVLLRRALGEGKLHDILVGFA